MNMNAPKIATKSSTLTLSLGPTIQINASESIAFALVHPRTWSGKMEGGDWRDPILAVLTPADLDAAGVTLAEVKEAIAFYTATEATVEATVEANDGSGVAYIIRAAGYRAGEAW